MCTHKEALASDYMIHYNSYVVVKLKKYFLNFLHLTFLGRKET